MKRRTFAAAALAIGTFGGARHAHAATTWKLATGYRAESFHGQNVLRFSAEAGLATAGKLRIEVYPDNALHRLADIWPAVTGGTLDAGETILTGLSNTIPIAGADAVPFIVGGYADAERLWRCQRPLVERAFEARGVALLYAVPWPPQGLFSRRPVASGADLNGTRMRTYNATTVRIAELLGAHAVDVPMTGVAKALTEDRIDTMITSAVTGVENAVWTHLKHFYDINAWLPKNVVFVRAAALHELPAATRQAVRDAAFAAEQRGWRASRQAAADSVETLRRNGTKVERTPQVFEREIKRLGERFSLEWVRQIGPEAIEIFVPYYTKP